MFCTTAWTPPKQVVVFGLSLPLVAKRDVFCWVSPTHSPLSEKLVGGR